MQSGGPPVSVSSGPGPGPGPAANSGPPVSNNPSKPANNVLRGSQQTSYHVPRGAAAVANIAMPRAASLATPIVRSGSAVPGSLVSLRGSSRAPNPAAPQPRVRATASPAHSASRPTPPQRVDTPRPALVPSSEKAIVKGVVPLSQVSGQTAPFVSSVTARVATAPSAPGIQPLQSVQVIAQGAQTTASVLSPSSTTTSPAAARPRPISQLGTPSSTPGSAPAVVLAAPARLASPGLLGVATGPARLTVAAAMPATGPRIVGPTTRLPPGRTVTYTSSHQVLQTARMPSAPVRLGSAGRGVLSLHPVLGVTPLKPGPSPAPALASSTVPASVSQSSAAPSGLPGTSAPSGVLSAPIPTPSPSPAPLRSLPQPAQPTQSAKVMSSAMVTVSAVSGGPLRSVVGAVPPGATSGTSPAQALAPALAPAPMSPAPASTTVVASKTASAYVQTSTAAAARPMAVAGQPPRPGPGGPGQPSVYIQAAHRASPGPAAERPNTFPLQPTTYFYEAPPGAYQVASVAGRPYAGAPPYIVQAAAARPSIVAGSSLPGSAASSSVASVVSTSGPAGAVASTIGGNVVSSVASGQSARFNSIMVVDPSRTTLHAAYVPAEGGATGATFIASDGSLMQALPVHSTATGAQPGPGPQVSQDGQQTQSVPVTSTAAGHLPVQIQMVSTPVPVHIQMQPQGHVSSHAPTHLASLPQTSHSIHTPILPAATQTTTQPQTNKLNASPRPSILRKRDNDGSPLKAQKNLTPLLQSMGPSNPSPSSNIVPNPAVSTPSSPPSPPKRPDSGGPQSSGSTTISATSSPGQESPPPGTQPPPSAASITAGLQAAGLHSNEMSPRKKPRKQQLTGNELQEHKGSEDEMEFLTDGKDEDFQRRQQQQQQQQQQLSVPPLPASQQQQQQMMHEAQQASLQHQHPQPASAKEFTLKRPNVSLLSTYRYSWKSRHNHFLRHSDVKPKDERRPTVSELAAQKHIFQRLNGWKVHHLTTQMEDLAEVESQVFQQLEAMLGVMEQKAEQDEDKDVNRVSELIKGNMQRSRVIADQLVEAKTTVMKIFDHKSHVAEIITRSSGKRTFKKRDKT